MKILYKALFALTCIVAVSLADPQGKEGKGKGKGAKGKGGKKAPPTERLNCKIVEPAPNTVWTMGEPQTVSWECEVDGPIEQVPPEQLIHIELGTGTGTDDFEYVDTIDAIAKAREIKFTWILLNKYQEGSDYVVRLRSKLKDDVDPVTPEESNLLPWVYSGPVTIIKEGTDPETLPKPQPKAGKTKAKEVTAPEGKVPKAKTAKEVEAELDEPKGKGNTQTADDGDYDDDASKTTPTNKNQVNSPTPLSQSPNSAISIEFNNVLLFGLGMVSSYFAL